MNNNTPPEKNNKNNKDNENTPISNTYSLDSFMGMNIDPPRTFEDFITENNSTDEVHTLNWSSKVREESHRLKANNNKIINKELQQIDYNVNINEQYNL